MIGFIWVNRLSDGTRPATNPLVLTVLLALAACAASVGVTVLLACSLGRAAGSADWQEDIVRGWEGADRAAVAPDAPGWAHGTAAPILTDLPTRS